MEPKASKCQQLNLRNNKEKEGLDEFQGESEKEDIGYILFLFIVPL